MKFEIISELNIFQFPQLPSQIFYIVEHKSHKVFGEESWNRDIARELKIPEADLKSHLFYDFNGWSPDGPFGYYPRVYFRTRRDAENALAWIESIQLMAQLWD